MVLQLNTDNTLRDFYHKQGKVFLPDIQHGIAQQVISDLAQKAMNEPDHIDLVINSSGGFTDEGFAIAQFIEFELNTPVHAYVSGICHSAATYALLCCKKRIANELASFVIHRQTTSITLEYGDTFDSELRDWQKENQKLHQKQLQFYATKLGLTSEEAEKLLSDGSKPIDNELNAREALKIGILTDVVTMMK